jgi:predicted transcriptional regulator
MADLVKTLWQLIHEESSVRRVAKELEVDRASLYRSLKKGTHPRIDTVVKILDHLGYELQVVKANKRTKKGSEGKELPTEETMDKGREAQQEAS